MRFVEQDNVILLIEKGKVTVKPYWKGKAREGRMRYDGLSFLISSTVPIQNSSIKAASNGKIEYSFTLKIPANTPVTLTYAVDDEYKAALDTYRLKL